MLACTSIYIIYSSFKRTLCAQYYRCAKDKKVLFVKKSVLWRGRKNLDIWIVLQQPSLMLSPSDWVTNMRGRTDGQDKRLYLFHYFVPPHFPRSPSRDPEIDCDASCWRMSQFRNCIWGTREGRSLLEWPWMSRVCEAAIWKTQIKGWKQHFVFCHERRANANSLLFIKAQITVRHNSSDVLLRFRTTSAPPTALPWLIAGALPPLPNPAQH